MESLKEKILRSLRENYSDYGEDMDEPINIIENDFDGKTISSIDFDIVSRVS